ncbi:putative mitochondrial protein [Apostasia shenzhenica]|uniref:Putative mitochondrial protein n=1 Tax=Apostasia shenzhenica TaxID=1088818 RepID=A0A2H9ZR05_9ASPA|nr:putative mitochondrial protein [Apostasia shenzhenica]
MPKRWKDTLVVLIPKVQGAELPSQFRPISLCTTIYKVIAKILINRVKDVLSSLISPEQGAFVPGRGIADNCLIAQEISPYLFILCSELLSLLINQHLNRDDLLGIRTTVHGPLITHLLFADDILMFAPATCKAVRALNSIFDVYNNWSGQKINKAKSSICFSKKMKSSRKTHDCLHKGGSHPS